MPRASVACAVLYSFRKGLETASLQVVTAIDGESALRSFEECQPDVAILDVRLPDMSGLDVFDRLRQRDPRLPVIIVTAHATTETAIDAMKRGAFEYWIKPIDIFQLQSLVAKALDLRRLQYVPATFGKEEVPATDNRIVGVCEPMQQVYKAIGRIAAEDVNVLILGESGTGKELVARAIYQHSRRAERQFLAVNCAALPESLLESELFGHEHGAFTGADRRRVGRFEQAHGGTLFLDEVGDMSSATQAKLLRVLQDGSFERLGGEGTFQSDVRVIAATNQDLDAGIAAGAFRADLLYRLNGFTVRLPPLRERMDDLPLLVEHFLRSNYRGASQRATAIAPEMLDILSAYHWPGNIRELESVIRYAVIHAVGEVITPECLPENCRQAPPRAAEGAEDAFPDVVRHVRELLRAEHPGIYRQVMQRLDSVVLREVLEHFRGNQVQASERLGMSRTTLRAKLSDERG